MLKTRILTALVLLACFIPSLFFLQDTIWAFVMLVLSLLALREWANMIGLSQIEKYWYLAASAALGLMAIYYMHYHFHTFFLDALNLFFVMAIFWGVVVPIWLAKSYTLKHPWLNALLGFLLLGSLWLALLCAKRVDPWALLVIISTIWIADSAAYFAGKNFGKHKLAPTISPGKTWEGVVGALIAVSIFALLICYVKGLNDWLILPGLWVITALGIYGDLFESMFKRQANLKDSGDLLPGHGGILDRIDGVIPAMPIGILLLYLYHYYQNTL
ncbi:MAG TPA: phosphatidate cytidylyltransferase [Methylophilaceae bacterium]|nr:phosphatidate cytidylyltransferase [Methylophilaceae bacterium]